MTIAKYIRLSIEDAKTDSLSIENQRQILDAHIADTFEYDAEVLEFVDNGYSGTNFERPRIQELLDMVRAGQIDCILVKDFSRFGRNIVETGYFIEQVFPLFRVRFIAVNDNYDSKACKNTGDLDAVFKYMCNELYSRDLSGKIRRAHEIKAKRGEWLSKNSPHGYMLDKDRQLVIDENAANAIRLIFRMRAEGKSLEDIRKALYTTKYPAPGEYKAMRRGKTGIIPQCIWGASVIKKILADEWYIGVYVAGKTGTQKVGSGKRVKKDESEWVKIPDHHSAIIEKDLFETVRTVVDANRRPPKRVLNTSQRYADSRMSPLKGKVVCGHCGHVMMLNCTKNASFRCNYSRAAIDAACHRLSVKEKDLADTLYYLIQAKAREILKSGFSETEGNAVQTESTGFEGCAEALQNLYEQFVDGDITAEAYREQKALLDADTLRSKQVQALRVAKADQEKSAKERFEEARRIAAKVVKTKTLTQETIDTLIEKVLLYQGNRIEVRWNVSGFADNSQNEMEGMKYAG
jgi:DNA invertase Pin-like site-specific DNA recombinase